MAGLAIGPGCGLTFQPTTLIPALSACSMKGADCVASSPPRTMPAGFSAIASDRAAFCPAAVPLPSSRRKRQPIAFAAARTASPTPRAPPFDWFDET
jgi:hypothetical protein